MKYSFRKVKVPAGQLFVKAMPVWCRSTIEFFLSGCIETVDFSTAREMPFSPCAVRGLRTSKKNYIQIDGDFTVFILRLTPAGLYGLLGIPSQEFSDQLTDLRLVHPSLFEEITERLMACRDIDSCVAVIEPYLWQLVQKNNRKIQASGAVNYMTTLITANRIPPCIGDLQQKICLSRRQLERNFVKEIGTTAKYYSRMVRFTNMLYHKMHYTGTKWPALAYEFNYTDQTHLVRDFQHFLGISPGEFSSDNFAGFETIPPSLRWHAY